MSDTPPSLSDPARTDRSDIEHGNWIVRWLPKAARPYALLARWDRPIGTWLLLLPCWWGLALAGHGSQESVQSLIWYGLLFAIGALSMRGAGCTWNDITDRDIDGKVARTATRPIPSGAVSVRQAFVFALLQSFIGLAVLSQFTLFASLVAVASLAVVAIYPFMKRVTYFPQLFLGIAFNWGALVAGALLLGNITLGIILIYGAGICWTMAYDTIYAHQDKEDDIKVGVKSTALAFGKKTRAIIAGFFAATLVLVASAALTAGIAGPLFWVGLAAAGAHFTWQVKTLDFDNPIELKMYFNSNRDAGLFITIGLAMGVVIGV